MADDAGRKAAIHSAADESTRPKKGSNAKNQKSSPDVGV
jgi:hypothetical protein